MASWAHEMGILWAFLVLLVLEGPAPALGQLEFICPGGKDGLYAHPTQCDRYFQCVNKKVKRRLCPDGLVFDKSRSEEDDPCNNIHNTKVSDIPIYTYITYHFASQLLCPFY